MHSVIVSQAPFEELKVIPRTVKEDLRERIRADRRRMEPAQREAAARELAAVALEVPGIARAKTVTAYPSTPSAPGTLPLRRALRRRGVRVLLPVLLGGGRLDWCEDLDDGSSPHDVHPSGDSPRLLGLEGVGQAEAMIVPALAVDTLGNRLGQGAGFYDRTLRVIDPTVPVFAVVYDGEVFDAAIEPVPVEPHDQPVDAIITPHRCLWLLPSVAADRRR